MVHHQARRDPGRGSDLPHRHRVAAVLSRPLGRTIADRELAV
jgi:hypothetical protein